MCTAISYQSMHHYFGRNLDYEYHFDEQVTITPRNFKLPLRNAAAIENHYAIIGIATIVDNFPLYYDATNEKGLSMAALNFPGNAKYQNAQKGFHNIAVFELIPWLLGQCQTTQEAKKILQQTKVIDIPFRSDFPTTPLHWMICDRNNTLTLEITETGMHIYDNPFHVLSNNPPFPYHKENINQYLNLTAEEPLNRFHPSLPLSKISRGMGAIGLPGDASSISRFIRAAFIRANILPGKDDLQDLSQCFHILNSVAQQEGCVVVGKGFEKTIYTSCCDTDSGIYYYTTYYNHQITAVDLHQHDLEGMDLSFYPLRTTQKIYWEN